MRNWLGRWRGWCGRWRLAVGGAAGGDLAVGGAAGGALAVGGAAGGALAAGGLWRSAVRPVVLWRSAVLLSEGFEPRPLRLEPKCHLPCSLGESFVGQMPVPNEAPVRTSQ